MSGESVPGAALRRPPTFASRRRTVAADRAPPSPSWSSPSSSSLPDPLALLPSASASCRRCRICCMRRRSSGEAVMVFSCSLVLSLRRGWPGRQQPGQREGRGGERPAGGGAAHHQPTGQSPRCTAWSAACSSPGSSSGRCSGGRCRLPCAAGTCSGKGWRGRRRGYHRQQPTCVFIHPLDGGAHTRHSAAISTT